MASELSESDREVWRTFYLMRRQLDRALERQLQQDASISMPDYEILVALVNAPERRLRARDLGELVAWEKSRLSHHVSRMVQRGLIGKVECGDDARGVWVTMTEEGTRAVLAAMSEHTSALRTYFFDALRPGDLAMIKDVSGRVLDAIDSPVCDILDEQVAGQAVERSA
jgi:DNA-binding MarR family transcriptional regulator